MTKQAPHPEPRRLGILGTGNIFGRYVEGLARYPELTVVRVGDIDTVRAEKSAAEYGIAAWGDDNDLYRDDNVEIIINLTPPAHHAPTTFAALAAGKHVYVEKPLATTLVDGTAVLAAARDSGLLLGSAPDTFLGSAVQTARHAVDHGLIGEPIGCSGFVRSSRVETWHPDPRPFFAEGGGPVLDMGPYYVASLVNCLGPVTTVAAATRIGAPRREVTSPGRVVDHVDVEVATHASATLTFASGAIGTLLMSFDIWDTDLPRMEIYGTEGTLSMANPNTFDGDVRVKCHADDGWQVLAPVVELFGALNSPEQFRRGLGVRDLAGALDGEPHRANPEFALHTLDVLTGIDTASRESRVVPLSTSCERPAPRS
jgi:predicted dehydrogenase